MSKLSYLGKRSDPRENARARGGGKEERLRRLLARSLETRFTSPNRRACSQAKLRLTFLAPFFSPACPKIFRKLISSSLSDNVRAHSFSCSSSDLIPGLSMSEDEQLCK